MIFGEESVANFTLALAVLIVANSCTDDAAHGKQDSICAEPQSVAHDVHVVVHASAHDVTDASEVFSENFAVETSDDAVLSICDSGID